ncbi:hypothetical protein DMB66_39200 [Actinoplanes sp. ATCC 53533]|uniref:hypothetical protein n=1 Tax=Actinoplanes sp. ATCC 53533 TaxID=1288362 RepID=UPI000F78C3F9|nr:hypothetical protein [Actinoplanes sp. ATCC 53533]RSM53253.1 hypothetical protein DMB66_39200 [Actinoplanes sp. ATCC 53533]
MLAPEAVAGIAATLSQYANGSREALLTPQFEIVYEYAPKNGPKTFDFNLIHESVWRGWDHDRRLPEKVELVEFLDLLTATAATWIPQQHKPRFTIIGFTLTYDEPATIPSDNDAGNGDVDPEPTRVAFAADVDGRRYHAISTGNQADPAQISEPGESLPDHAVAPALGYRRIAAMSALARLIDIATSTPGPQPDPADNGGLDPDELAAGELVTVTGDGWDDDQRGQLWVVLDTFLAYTIAVLGGDGYQWPNVPRGELTPVTPDSIQRVQRSDGTYGYVGADSTHPGPTR